MRSQSSVASSVIRLHKLFPVLLITMVLVGCGATTPTTQPAQPTSQATRIRSTPLTIQEQNPVTLEEYAIYSIILNSQLNKTKLFVIRDRTGLWHSERGEEQLREDKPELVSNFQSANRQIYPLKHEFKLPQVYLLLSEEEYKSFFAPNSVRVWKNFHEKYPDANKIWSFSRVGFSQDATQALVYYEYECGSNCAGGQHILLVKKDGNWTIEGTSINWIS